MDTRKFPATLFLSLLLLALSTTAAGCRKRGPMGMELDRSRREYDRLDQIKDPQERKTAGHRLLESSANLLSDSSYRDPIDQKGKTEIMYHASILMTATAERIEAHPLAIQFYMNAYLLKPTRALADLMQILPGERDWQEYRDIRIPPYRISGEKRSVLPDYQDPTDFTKKSQGSVAPPEGTGHIRLSLHVKTDSSLSVLMLQLIAGDILFRRREKSPELTSMVIVYTAPGRADYAYAFWDAESDRITIQLKNDPDREIRM